MTLRKMLAVTHEATLTGAPMNLSHLLRWISRNTDVEVHTLIVKDGPLRHRFEAAGEVTVLDTSPVGSLLSIAQQGLVHLGSRRAWRPIALARLTPQLRHLRDLDLVYANSLTSIGVVPFLPHAGTVVAHVHELQVAIRTWQPQHDYQLFQTLPDRWIAASAAVQHHLVDEIGLPADRVLLHREFIDTSELLTSPIPPREIEARRRELGIPPDASVVMGSGTLDWRKGPELFVQLATEVRRRTREPVSFVWVGGDRAGTDWERVRSDRDRSGADHVHFIGVKPDPRPWFAIADVFALTSHEDPFPLVCLEHAALGHPIVTYENGGMPELLEAAGPEASEGIIAHLDVGAMADRVIALLQSDDQRDKAGRQLRERVLACHDVEVAAPRLFEDLERTVHARQQQR